MSLNGLPLSLSQIKAFFSGNGVNNDLQSYYRGEVLVPNVAQNTNIPTGGVIKISNFVTASHWPIDPNQIVPNIPAIGGYTFPGGASSSHGSSWFINPANNQVVQGSYDGSSGSADATLTGGAHPEYNGPVSEGSPLGNMIAFQNFLLTYCIGNGSVAPSYAQYDSNTTYATINYGTTINHDGGPSGGTSMGGIYNGPQLVAAAIYLALRYITTTGYYENQLLQKLITYTWNSSTISSNFSNFAAWVAAN